jgi:hypothetical protein
MRLSVSQSRSGIETLGTKHARFFLILLLVFLQNRQIGSRHSGKGRMIDRDENCTQTSMRDSNPRSLGLGACAPH